MIVKQNESAEVVTNDSDGELESVHQSQGIGYLKRRFGNEVT